MSLYLKELSDLDGFLSLRQSISDEEWAACLAQVQASEQCKLSELLQLVDKMGASHLEAVREFEQIERDKGCIPTYLRQFCPV